MAHTSDKTPVLAIQRIWTRQDKMSLIKAIADQSILHSNDEFWGCLQKKSRRMVCFIKSRRFSYFSVK